MICTVSFIGFRSGNEIKMSYRHSQLKPEGQIKCIPTIYGKYSPIRWFTIASLFHQVVLWGTLIAKRSMEMPLMLPPMCVSVAHWIEKSYQIVMIWQTLRIWSAIFLTHGWTRKYSISYGLFYEGWKLAWDGDTIGLNTHWRTQGFCRF